MASESPTSKCSNRVISPYILESGETNGQNFQIECIESSINYSDNVDHNENQGAVLPEDTMASPLTELLTSRIDRRVDYISHQLDPASHEISIPYLSEDEFIQNQSRGFAMAQSRGVWVGMPQDIARRRAAAAADDDDSLSDPDSMPELVDDLESHFTDAQGGMTYKPIVSPSFSALTIVPDRINHEIILCLKDGHEVHDWLYRNDFEAGDLRCEVWVEGVGQVCPMAYACCEGDIKKCKWLYENGAEEDITKRNERGETPMLLASMKAHLKICQWLYEMGAASDVITARKDGFHPTLFACKNGCLPLCKWLFAVGAAGDVTREDVAQTTPMLLACGGGYLDICKWLLTAGAGRDVSRPNADGETPMLKACYNGHLHVCEWLLEQGADGDICRPNTFGSTPLLWCCARGHLSLCRWLHKHGAAKDIRTPDKHGMSPMLWACMKGHLSICKWLYEVGAAGDVAVTDAGGYTPMLRAYWGNRSPVCQWLILNGALNNTITQHIDHAMVRNETREVTHHRESLFIWAQELLAARETFVSVVLCCRSESSATAPSGDHESCEGTKSGDGVAAGGGGSSKLRRIGLSNIPGVVLERIASLVGIPTERRLRNLREFKVAIQLLIAD